MAWSFSPIYCMFLVLQVLRVPSQFLLPSSRILLPDNLVLMEVCVLCIYKLWKMCKNRNNCWKLFLCVIFYKHCQIFDCSKWWYLIHPSLIDIKTGRTWYLVIYKTYIFFSLRNTRLKPLKSLKIPKLKAAQIHSWFFANPVFTTWLAFIFCCCRYPC